MELQGPQKKGVATFLKNLIQEYQFHFVGLQETMIKECEDTLLRKFDPIKNSFGCGILPEENLENFSWSQN